MALGQGWKKPGFKKKPNQVSFFFIETRVLLVFLGFMGFMGFSKRKENQKVLYADSKIIFM